MISKSNTPIVILLLLLSVPSFAQQQSNKKGFKTYTNKQFGISFNYPSNAMITEKQYPGRSDLGSNYDPPYVITVNVPFIKKYGKWTSKGVTISIRDGTCDWGSLKVQPKTLNGITYSFLDPDRGATSGMSSVNKERMYYYQSSDKCYSIVEAISGYGINEGPRNRTVPPNEDTFINSEIVALDQIVSTFKISPPR